MEPSRQLVHGRSAACFGALVLAGLVTTLAPASAHAAVASFTYSPSEPATGEVVTFTSQSTGTVTSEDWDLDGSGGCDDAHGPSAQRSFPTAGEYAIRLCVNGSESLQQQTVTVRNRPPVAAFAYTPANPVVGETVALSSMSEDPDGPLVSQDWSLQPDDAFGGGLGASATRSWPAPGLYPVSLRVVDRDGAVSVASHSIRVFKRPPELLSPFPVVRLVGRLTRTGVRITSLVVQAPRGARVQLRCSGRGCPYRRAVGRAAGPVSFRRVRRAFRAGTVFEVSVTKAGTIGKYTRFRIRKGHSPARVDRCLSPGLEGPVPCPAS